MPRELQLSLRTRPRAAFPAMEGGEPRGAEAEAGVAHGATFGGRRTVRKLGVRRPIFGTDFPGGAAP